MVKPLKRIAVTGGGGQIAYSLLFRIASGELFGKEQPIALHLLEVFQGLKVLEGVVMELVDCAYPLLKEIKMGDDPLEIFENVDVALLIGAKPRSPGMERKGLLQDNGKIFVWQGQALNRVASRDVIVFVVGNPCNTNCLIAMHHAPDIPRSRFFAMTRLDQNRAQYQLASKGGVAISDVDHVTIWGNHSTTQVPDFINATIKGKPATDMIADHDWLRGDFIKTVQKRGAEVLSLRGRSSAASAANAILDGVKAICEPSHKKTWHSTAILSDRNPYNIKEGLIFSFPCVTDDERNIAVVEGLDWDPFLQEKIALTEKELLEERDMIAHLLK